MHPQTMAGKKSTICTTLGGFLKSSVTEITIQPEKDDDDEDIVVADDDEDILPADSSDDSDSESERDESNTSQSEN
ncbi:hypothetical protein EVAR_23969_1 [Eumeta japonica]|uniref:Uncharacterized protein n=1 Tax=Eumeta variegata TaxID=151549 RepID=A0A4C1V2P2_EUMVA|nr:hypothetical protein EVAR_23969_1 [Eumeta japonica]